MGSSGTCGSTTPTACSPITRWRSSTRLRGRAGKPSRCVGRWSVLDQPAALETPLGAGLAGERRRRGQRSLTIIIHIVTREWLDLLHNGTSRSAMRVGSKCTATKKSSTTDTGLFLRGKPPWGIPDGVYSCGEVI